MNWCSEVQKSNEQVHFLLEALKPPVFLLVHSDAQCPGKSNPWQEEPFSLLSFCSEMVPAL